MEYTVITATSHLRWAEHHWNSTLPMEKYTTYYRVRVCGLGPEIRVDVFRATLSAKAQRVWQHKP